jgi:hypothetical protein
MKNKIKMNIFKKIFEFIGGFFASDSNNSSKRLVGIAGAFTFFYTLYQNSKSEAHVVPAESLIWGTVVMVLVSLGLTTVESVGNLISNVKNGGTKKEDQETIKPE